MKLITKHGELPLPENFSIEVKKESPFFSKSGESTLPITLIATPMLERILGFPSMLNNVKMLNVLDVTIQNGLISKAGKLLFSSFSDKEYTGAIGFAESDLYLKNRNKSLQEILVNKNIQLVEDINTSNLSTAVQELALKIYDNSIKNEGDFVAFPVAVDKSDTGFFLLNEPEFGIEMSPALYKIHSRMITTSSGEEIVPAGYGIAPFIYLYRLIEIIADELGYTIAYNIFREDEKLKKIVLLHTCADTICTGVLHYGDIVPSVTLTEFFDFLLKQFFVAIDVNSEKKEFTIISLDEILSKPASENYSSIIDINKLSIDKKKRVVLKMNTSLEGAAPISETKEDFYTKYQYVTEENEHEYRTSNKSLVYRRATGVFESNKFNVLTGEFSEKKKLSSSYFSFSYAEDDVEIEEFSSPAVLAVMGFVNSMLVPYCGNRYHRYTSVEENEDKENEDKKNEDKKNKQDIIMCNFLGTSLTSIESKTYLYGNVLASDDAGYKINSCYDLTPEGCYVFFKKWNDIIRTGKRSISCYVNLDHKRVLSINNLSQKNYNGTSILPVKVEYNIPKLISSSAEFIINMKDDNIRDKKIIFRNQELELHTENDESSVKQIAIAELLASLSAEDRQLLYYYEIVDVTYTNNDELDKYIFSPQSDNFEILYSLKRNVIITIKTQYSNHPSSSVPDINNYYYKGVVTQTVYYI